MHELIHRSAAVHVIRIYGIYEKSRAVLFGMSSLFAVQIVVTAICCGFYRCERILTVCPPNAQFKFSSIYSRTSRGRSRLYRRSKTQLGRHILGCPHSSIHCVGELDASTFHIAAFSLIIMTHRALLP